MKISETLEKRATLSFEVFPPKDDGSLAPLEETLRKLAGYKPDFVSITYGAGGTNVGRSVDVCRMALGMGHAVMPHFTCIGNTRDGIASFIGPYLDLGIENLLLLRGDLPEGWTGTRGDFTHASELIAFFEESYPGLCLAAAAYPEVHIESQTAEEDVRYLRLKQDLGASFFLTQLCHDVTAYERFRERLAAAGVTIPVVIGLMPILSRAGTIRMSLSNGVSIPADLAAICGRYEKDEESFRKAGMEFTVGLIERYIAAGIDGLHLYTLNRHEDVSTILDSIDLIGFRKEK
ncbi:MAG: methylenetetrahydrofolate reductase [Clostridiales Family XIII bacterium]|nr:methylenetetrahydrofolate reductase [Clostridiales Family XIII bacterium]